MEARPTEQDLREAFARIEVAVEAGDSDLRQLGFWRLVEEVKRQPEAADRWAEQIGRIDRTAFRGRVRLRVPVWAGNVVLIAGVALGALGVVIAKVTHRPTLAGVALVASGAIWSVATHCLAHWAVGRVVGIRFSDYFVGGPFPPRPGLKTDYASYLRTEPARRAAMHAAGAIATKLSPFVALGFWPATEAPWWSAALLLALGVLQIVTDVLFSVKSSDWKKVKRERALVGVRAEERM